MPKKFRLGRYRKYHYKKKSFCTLLVNHGPTTHNEAVRPHAKPLVVSLPLKMASAPTLVVMQKWIKDLSILPQGMT